MDGVRRELSLWEHWVRMMVWGWYDPVGRRLPLWTEEELYRMMKGLPPKAAPPPTQKAGAEKDAEGKIVNDGGEKQGPGGKEGEDEQK